MTVVFNIGQNDEEGVIDDIFSMSPSVPCCSLGAI